MPSPRLTLFVTLLLAGSVAKGQYRNYSLRCLAPLAEAIDPNAPKTLQEAFLAGPKRFAEPIEGIGAEAVRFTISTESEEAQEMFVQGIALLHLLWYKEAERAFRTVIELDPDCPMGYWGMAQANERSPQRARVFANAALERCDRNHPLIEQRWTALLAGFYSKLDQELAVRSSERIRSLEELALDFPDHLEVRAFLIRRLTLDQYIAGLSVTSTLGVDSLAKQFASDVPEHPSRHYRVFLWMERRPELLLDEALHMTGLSPDASEIWRYASEAHLAAGRLAEAVELGEIALRIDHRNLSRRSLMPWQAQNLSESYEALINLLIHSGRIEEARSWAERAVSLPRNLKTNEPSAERLWGNGLLIAGQWEKLLKDLESEPLLRASENFRDRASRLSWMGTAHHALGQNEKAMEAEEDLKQLEREAIIEGVSSSDELAIAESHRTLKAVRHLFSSSDPSSSTVLLEETDLPSLAKSRLYELSGRKGEAFRKVASEIENSPYRWLPTAFYCRLASETGHQREALFPIDRRFRIDAARSDPGLPVLEDLGLLAAKLRLPEDWMLSAPRKNLPAPTGETGSQSWQAPEAANFKLKDRLDQTWSLDQFSGKPVLINFFLGVQCAFCLKQFETFQPYLPRFEEAGIKVVAVTIDSTDKLKQILGGGADMAPTFRDRFPFPVLADPELNVFRKYGVFDEFESGPMHATVLVGPGGKILWRNVGHIPFEKPSLLLKEAKRLLKIQDTLSSP